MKPANYATGYVPPQQPASQHQHHQHPLPPWQQQQAAPSQPSSSSHGHHRHHSASSASNAQRQHNATGLGGGGATANGQQQASSAQQQQQGDFASSSSFAGGAVAQQGQHQTPYNYPNQYAQAEANRMEQMAREQQQLAAQQQQQQQAQQAGAQGAQVAAQQDRVSLQQGQVRQIVRDQPPRVPLADRDVFMLSLPSQDQPSYYDSSSAASDSEPDDPANSCSLAPTTNRGNKLSSSAPHIRRGRLGSYPHTDVGFPTTSATSSKRRKLLSGLAEDAGGVGGFALTPNLHLLPRGVPSMPPPAVLPPAPQSPLDLLLSSSMQYTFGPKNKTFKTLAMSAQGLIDQEGPLIGSLSRVCSGLRGEGFEFRWVGDEEVKKEREKERAVEEEEERVKREKRRKEEEEKRRERREREEKERIEREEREKREEEERLKKLEVEEREEAERRKKVEEEERVEREKKEKEERERKAKEEEEERVKEEEAAKLRAIKVEEEAAASASAALKDDNPAQSSTVEGATTSSEIPPDASLATTAQATGATVEGTTPAPDLSTSSLPALPGALPPLPAGDAEALTSNAMDVDVPTSTTDTSAPILSLGELPPLPDALPTASATATDNDDGDTPMAASASADADAEDRSGADEAAADDLLHGNNSAGGEDDEEEEEEEATTRRRSGRVATRSSRARAGDGGSTSDSGGEDGEDSDERAIRRIERAEELAAEAAEEDSAAGSETPPRVVEEEIPEYAKRLVDPEVYVRSLFVSEGAVEMPSREALQAQAAGMGGLAPGVPATESLSPNEQEVLLHDCLTDLHRFLADSLEYRSRLSEIRDGVLGVERRRKGMWKVVRTVGQDWMDEESEAQAAER